MLFSPEKIKEFIDKVLSTDQAFTIADGTSSPDWFIQSWIGKSKIIYETKDYRSEGSEMPGFEAEFVAMVTDGKVYMSQPTRYIMSDDKLPKELVIIEQKAAEYQEEGEQMVDEFYKSLKPSIIEAKDNYKLIDLWKIARSCVLGMNSPEEFARACRPNFYISVGQAYALEAWRLELKDLVDAHCADQAEKMAFIKGRDILLRKQMADPDIVDPWEKEIVKSLNGLDAKSVAVEFTKNGIRAVAKMSPETLLKNLLKRTPLNEWDFCVYKQGKQLLDTLVGKRPESDGRLYCSDINTIVFRGKVIYKKEIK